MNNLVLRDDVNGALFPFTLTRSAADIRIGILTIREKWIAYLGTEPPLNEGSGSAYGGVQISAATIPTRKLIDSLVAGHGLPTDLKAAGARTIRKPWEIFLWNDWALREDFQLVTGGRHSDSIPGTVHTTNPADIFIEEGAQLSHCILNADTGPIYIGKNAQIMEGSVIRGPFALCEGAVVKIGSKIYGATTIGPYSIVGGEIKNSVVFGYSNKSHEGYLGDSVIGEWCNLGAGTSNSNLKNNASDIRMYDHATRSMIDSGVNKCGLLMGDYSRAAINTSFNTGTTVGVCANVFTTGLTPKYIASFAWGVEAGEKYDFEKAMSDIDKWKRLKGQQLSEQERIRLKLIFDQN